MSKQAGRPNKTIKSKAAAANTLAGESTKEKTGPPCMHVCSMDPPYCILKLYILILESYTLMHTITETGQDNSGVPQTICWARTADQCQNVRQSTTVRNKNNTNLCMLNHLFQLHTLNIRQYPRHKGKDQKAQSIKITLATGCLYNSVLIR